MCPCMLLQMLHKMMADEAMVMLLPFLHYLYAYGLGHVLQQVCMRQRRLLLRMSRQSVCIFCL